MVIEVEFEFEDELVEEQLVRLTCRQPMAFSLTLIQMRVKPKLRLTMGLMHEDGQKYLFAHQKYHIRKSFQAR